MKIPASVIIWWWLFHSSLYLVMILNKMAPFSEIKFWLRLLRIEAIWNMPRDLPQRNFQRVFMTCVWGIKHRSPKSKDVIKAVLTLPLKGLFLFHASSQYCASFIISPERKRHWKDRIIFSTQEPKLRVYWCVCIMMFWNSSSGNVLVRAVRQRGKRSHECSRSVSGPLPGFLQLCLWGMDEEEPAAGGEVPLGSFQQPVGTQHGGDEEPTG